MRIAVLGASGALGTQLVRQALDRGHHVVALVRDPQRFTLPGSARLQVAVADVSDPGSLVDRLDGVDALVSGLGLGKASPPGVMTAGARAIAAARGRHPDLHVVWIGALGSGPSARAAGGLIRAVVGIGLKAELPDRNAAEAMVLQGKGTVFHSGPMTNGPLSAARRTVELADAPRRPWPKLVSRATVAAEMLDEAESRRHAGQVVIPLP
jgi:uncharacterized protein YbjT (DUF2867 family)